MRSRSRAAFSNSSAADASAHLLGEPRADRPAPAGQEIARLRDESGIVVEPDLAGAGARASLDLVEEAGPGAVRVEAVRAGAQEERPLQRVHRTEDRAGAGEGPEIVAREGAGPPVLDKSRRGVAGADQNIGEALVVAQGYVVARLQLLDEIGLEQQRLGFRFGGDEHHRARLGDHPRDAGGLALGRQIGGDALLDRARLADIQHFAFGADHSVDAGTGRRVTPESPDCLGASREIGRLRRRLVDPEIERRRVRRELLVERRHGACFGFGRLARRIFRLGGHGPI